MSTTMHPSATSLCDFPSEILLFILQVCNGSSLQSLRASCSLLCKLVTPILFETIYLYPHAKSFEELSQLSQTPSIRKHVQRLVFDLRYTGLPKRIDSQIESVCSAHVSPKEKIQARRKVLEFEKETIGFTSLTSLELILLRDILRNLALKSLAVIEVHPDSLSGITAYNQVVSIDNLPKIYRKLRESTCQALSGFDFEPGDYMFGGTTTCSKMVLLAAHGYGQHLEELELYNCHYSSIMDFGRVNYLTTMRAAIFTALKSLRIHGTLVAPFVREDTFRSLNIILHTASELEFLDLSFGCSPENPALRERDLFPCGEKDTRSVLEALEYHRLDDTQSNWGRSLRELSFSGLRFSGSELCSILKRCKGSLQALHLRDVFLLREPAAAKESPGCLVKFLGDIAKFTSVELKAVHLNGHFTNGREQMWVFKEPGCRQNQEVQEQVQSQPSEKDVATLIPAEDNLQNPHMKDKIERFAVAGGSCPVDMLRVGPIPTEYNLIVEGFLDELEEKADKSFQIASRALNSDGEPEDLSDLEMFDSEDEFEEEDSDEDDAMQLLHNHLHGHWPEGEYFDPYEYNYHSDDTL